MPDQMREFIKSRIKTGEYQSPSDYMRDLIRHDKEEIDLIIFAILSFYTQRFKTRVYA